MLVAESKPRRPRQPPRHQHPWPPQALQHSPRCFHEPVDGADADAQLQRAVELSRAATPRSTGEQAMQLEAARLAALAADRRLAESLHESERQRQQQLELSHLRLLPLLPRHQ
jgi:hypothetical protein